MESQATCASIAILLTQGGQTLASQASPIGLAWEPVPHRELEQAHMNPTYVVRLKDGTTRQVVADSIVTGHAFVELWFLGGAVAIYPACEVQEVHRTDLVKEGE
ncbi:hypothetical protein ABFD31_09945 [Streptococcus agalactiae]|uniref:hypothetical protein n=1 Tax=Streptococcus agalactiae TaxID=1311 RepID=UPI003F03D0F6